MQPEVGKEEDDTIKAVPVGDSKTHPMSPEVTQALEMAQAATIVKAEDEESKKDSNAEAEDEESKKAAAESSHQSESKESADNAQSMSEETQNPASKEIEDFLKSMSEETQNYIDAAATSKEGGTKWLNMDRVVLSIGTRKSQRSQHKFGSHRK
eukprot:12407047-Karenia_brevis.AAC.1